MTKNQLKSALKPLIKQCIKEVVFEDGVLSGIIAEVAKGLSTPVIAETPAPKFKLQENTKSDRTRENRKMLLDAIGKDSYNGVNIFENTEPLSKGGSAKGAPTAPAGALSNYDPSDEGVSIDGLFSIAGKNWKKLI